MSELIMTKLPGGQLIPATDEDAAELMKIKAGTAVRVDVKQIRNYKFLQKWFTLAKYAYGIWEEGLIKQEYKGVPVSANFDRFRKDLIILCGFYEPVYNARNEVRLEAKSISFARMNEDEFEKLYSQTINVILTKILNGKGVTEEALRHHVDNVLRYSG